MLQAGTRTAVQAACRAPLLAAARKAPAARQTTPSPSSSKQLLQPRPRWLATLARRAQEERPAVTKDLEIDEENSVSLEPNQTSTAAASASPDTDSLPWYLKVDVPKHATLVPQETPLPDIPPNSPSLMQPMLTFIAEDLGLDDLALLDLRALDPPAGLGPELLMLFGTARSERHLHVSADRLVRWLRSRGIRANADGLLGRNELKIKLRRKARRAKLLGGAATVAPLGPGQPVDDGISTQWVCLHAGTLGSRGTTTTEGSLVDAEGRVSGFGTVRTGNTVVVQMMTEAKRKQLDLETLWTRTLARSLKGLEPEEAEVDEALEDDIAADESEAQSALPKSAAESVSTTPDTSQTTTTAKFPTVPQQQQQQQQRFFSTSARRLTNNSETQTPVSEALLSRTLSLSRLAELGDILANSREEKLDVLEQLAAYLNGLPEMAVLMELGHWNAQGGIGGDGPGALNSAAGARSRGAIPSSSRAVASRFSRVSMFCMRDLSAADSWAFRSSVYSRALQVKCPGYSLAGMGELVREMQVAGVPLSTQKAAELLRGIFSAPLVTDDTLPQMCSVTLSLLDTLHERAVPTLDTDMAMAAVAGLAEKERQHKQDTSSYTVLNSPGSLKFGGGMARSDGSTDPVDRLQDAIEDMLRQTGLRCPSEQAIMGLLTTYARRGDWDRFWGAWRIFPQHGQGRSRAMYKHLYDTVAQTGEQTRCFEAIRWCFQEMLQETPRVQPTGEVLRALKACIFVADENAHKAAQMSFNSKEMVERFGYREMPHLLREIEAFNA